MDINEAVARLRELGEAADLDSAAHLVRQLNGDDERRLNDPLRLCDRECRIATKKTKWDEHCPCLVTTLALRLTELAFGERQASQGRMVLRHRIKCPACGIPFVSRRKGARYCAGCEGRKTA